MKLAQKYIDVLEARDWAVSSYTNDGRVELETYSPAGEDFCICVEVENFPEAVMKYWEDFDRTNTQRSLYWQKETDFRAYRAPAYL